MLAPVLCGDESCVYIFVRCTYTYMALFGIWYLVSCTYQEYIYFNILHFHKRPLVDVSEFGHRRPPHAYWVAYHYSTLGSDRIAGVDTV